jgi:hypothetical protein
MPVGSEAGSRGLAQCRDTLHEAVGGRLHTLVSLASFPRWRTAKQIAGIGTPVLFPCLKNQVERRGCGPAEVRKARL